MEILREITTDLDVLRQKSRKVDKRHKIAELFSVMEEVLGQERVGIEMVGLSAVQFGVPLRVIVFKDSGLVNFIVNPEITKERGTQLRNELCLSVPEVGDVRVRRPQQIIVRGLNRWMNPVKYRLAGLGARVVCHEVGHLNGILITDHQEVGCGQD